MSVKPNYETLILDVVSNNAGIRNVYVVLNIMQHCGPVMFNIEDYDIAIADLLRKGDIIELEVVLPIANYKIKSLFFPKGTKFVAIKDAANKVEISYHD